VGVAALLAGKVPGTGGACAVVSGGNIDPTTLISVLRHGMTVEGRYLAMRTRLVDRPGELIRVCQLIAAERGNIVQVEHRREGVHLEVGDVGLDLTVSMRNEEHCRRLIATLEANGFPVERLR
jgi:threonine dehydratase